MTRRPGKHPALSAPYGTPDFSIPKGRMTFVSEFKEPPTDHNRQLDYYRLVLDLENATVTYTYPALTEPQAKALEEYAKRFNKGPRSGSTIGATWRLRLTQDWEQCSEPADLKPELRQIRNVFGPTWLTNVYAWGWLPEMPVYDHLAAFREAAQEPDGSLPIWSNAKDPPAVGARVKCRVNGFGPGTVTGYFTQDGYLGVIVRIDQLPDRFVKQNDDDRLGHWFGAEIEVL